MKGVFVVHNKQKSNKINTTALITCFMLIMVFVFGCVDFAKADSDPDISNGSLIVQIKRDAYMQEFIWSPSAKGKFCGVANTSSPQIASLVSLESFNLTQINNTYRYGGGKDSHSTTSLSSYYASDLYRISTGNLSDSSIKEFIVSGNFLIFATDKDAYKYLKTGEINNLVYYPAGYDENIPTPKNLEIYFDRKLNKPFNLGELCNPLKIKWTTLEDSDYSDYTLDVQIDVNYNKLNSIGGIGTKPTVLQTGKVEFASCSATDKELNISATYDGWTKLSKKYQTSIWGLTGNYFDLWLRYKDSSGNYGNWVKVTINPDNSSTVIKAGLFDNGTNTTINKGYEEISGDNGEHVSGDYDNYYVNTLGENISNNLTALKNNYSNLVSFYKELFSFLPAEIWIILIGLVSTMVVIAIIKFVRG